MSVQVDGVSLQGCSEQTAVELLRRTGPEVKLKLLRRAGGVAQVPRLQLLQHRHSFSEENSSSLGLKMIQEKGTKMLETLVGASLDQICINIYLWNS